MPIMPALCSMLLVTYYAFNYAGIIGQGLVVIATGIGFNKSVSN